MSKTVISVRNLGKKYRLGATLSHDTLRDHIMHTVGRLLGRRNGEMRRVQKEEFWALKDVSFDVQEGEVLGIIGANGSGKSTLLKILTGITEPTEGEVRMKGRVGSLLEVGTGFHQELTGRENIYMNGAILGMTRAEINAKFNEIVAFSGVEKFLDTPVKRYSSGMRIRLGFAVAAHLEPEILLIDEVLAVGDASFQKKCLGKMDEIARGGRTVLFVSHNMQAIRLPCGRCALLGDGRVLLQGPPDDCVSCYLHGADGDGDSISDHTISMVNDLTITSVLINQSNRPRQILSGNRDRIEIRVAGIAHAPMQAEIEARIFDIYRTPLAFFSPGHERGEAEVVGPGPFEIVRIMALPRMNHGDYLVDIDLTHPGVHTLARIPNAIHFLVEGCPTHTGHVFEYNKGAGWVFLSEPQDPRQEG
jgi:lipopolysaccharide transport system ATP-binding protein